MVITVCFGRQVRFRRNIITLQVVCCRVLSFTRVYENDSVLLYGTIYHSSVPTRCVETPYQAVQVVAVTLVKDQAEDRRRHAAAPGPTIRTRSVKIGRGDPRLDEYR